MGYSTYQSYKRYKQGTGSYEEFVVKLTVFVMLFLALIFAIAFGTINNKKHTAPYKHLGSLNSYVSVNPSQMRGQQLMDAGTVLFGPGTFLNFARSMAFKVGHTYCVVPIQNADNIISSLGSSSQVGNASGIGNSSYAASSSPGNNTNQTAPAPWSLDFWAVGVDCCSSTPGSFRCGEYWNPLAKSGIRLLDDAKRPYFRLAVQAAESAFNVRAVHPLFFTWVQDPYGTIASKKNAALQNFMFGFVVFFVMEFFIFLALVLYLMKHI